MNSDPAGNPLVTLGIHIGIGLIWNVIICAILNSCMQRIPARHRTMEPGLIWLLLIPCVNLIWSFFVVVAVANSFKSYFAERNEPYTDGFGLGLAFCIVNLFTIIPCVGCAFSPIAFILAVLFLVRMVNLRDKVGPDEPLAEQPSGQ